MIDFWMQVLIVAVMGYFWTQWAWCRGFRRGYMADLTDTQQALAKQLERVLREEPTDV